MNYILLDLEWNQAYFEQAQAVQKRLNCRLRGEVIQIGAIKLSEKREICGSFSTIVRPRYFRRMHRHVAQLTGITQEMMDRGAPLSEAAERFRRWCGTNAVLLTWGPDDVPMFTDNLRAHGLPTDWLPPTYDLQIIYNRQTDGSSKQRSLEYAMQQFGIEQHLPAHDALNDAYFTACVAAKLDLARGIKEYDDRQGQYLDCTVFGDADVGERGFATSEAVLRDARVSDPVCPTCGKPLKKLDRLLHAKGQKYSLLCECPTHGQMMMTLRLVRNLDGSLRAKRMIVVADEATVAAYRSKLAAVAAARTTARRRHRSHRGKKKATAPAAVEQAQA
ncbi:MAG: exonuclease domain-containing protein [Clostridia bacterium]|nr:exonuclease domain-containing protein [Clostridia bacterium]